MSAPLRLLLLGAYQLQRGNQPLTDFESDKARALLAYLALSPGVPQRREALCALLWPDLPDRDARHNLSQVLSSLRSLLDDRSAEHPVLLANRQTVQVSDGAALEVDVLHFEALLQRCRRHQHPDSGRCEPCSAWLHQAVDLYRGDFLHGFSLAGSLAFDDWAALQRERCHRLALDALRRLAGYHEARGELEEAQRYARRQLALEPWLEEAHRQLMRLLAHDGRRTAALTQYERCRRSLAETFGVPPAAETTALFRRIRQAQRSRHEHLPSPPSPFIGRRRELAQLAALLADPDRRLLTIVGPGGSGKTRLALALARRVQTRFLDGVAVVFLAPLMASEQVASATVTALELPFGDGDPLPRLVDYLREKELLLLLDNCEHLPGTAAVVTQLLEAAPDLTVVATSRHPLHLSLETRYPLGGLAVSGAATDDERDEEALQLFLQAARRARPDFVLDEDSAEDARHICRLVEGLPLAVEMAAAWVRAVTCAEIAAEIQRSLDFLVTGHGDVAPRHRSMRAVWNHSWALLTPEERLVLRQLTVFRGGCTLEAIRRVTEATPAHLTSLVDKSLLQRHDKGRYGLHELVRRYATEEWDSSPAEQEVARRHCDYYLQLVASQEAMLWGPAAGEARLRLRPELENVHRAWRCAVEQEQWPALAAALEAIAAFYRQEGLVAQAQDTFGQAADRVAEVSLANIQNALFLSRLLTHRARFLLKLGRGQEAEYAAQQALAIAEQLEHRGCLAAAKLVLAQVQELRGEHEAAAGAYREAYDLYRVLQDDRGMAEALSGLGNTYWRRANYEEALQQFQAALALDRAHDNRAGVTRHLSNMSTVYREMGRFQQALDCLEEAAALATEMDHRENIARTANNMGLAYWQLGRHQEARNAFLQALAIAEELGLRHGIVHTVSNLGVIERERGRYAQALAHYRRAIAVARDISLNNALATTLGNVGNIYRDMGRFQKAWPYYEEALALDEALGNREGVGRHWGEIARWHSLQGQHDAAHDHMERAVARLREVGARYYLASLLPALALMHLRQGNKERAQTLNDEGHELACAVGRRQAQVQAAITAAHLAAAEANSDAAQSDLQSMLEQTEEPDLAAALHYALWQVTGDRHHSRRALAHYRRLAESTPHVTYQRRRDELLKALQADAGRDAGAP